MERLYHIKTVIDEVGSVIKNVYLVDVVTIVSFCPEWSMYSAGVTHPLSVPDMPLELRGIQFIARAL